MIFLFFSIVFSVSVSVFLKMASVKKMDLTQAVAMNYWVAIVAVLLLLKPSFTPEDFSHINWFVLVSLGVLLPSIFLLMGKAVQETGIIRTDAAQRLSLFIPIVASFTYFGEHLSQPRFVGLILAFAALFCLLDKPAATHKTMASNRGWLYLLAVWLGFGLIDIGFKNLSVGSFALTLLLVFALSAVFIWLYLLCKRPKLDTRSLLAGMVLGGLNFANIYCYIKAHQAFKSSPTLVFAGMNIGVIVLGLLIGALVFKEKLSRWNGLGIVLAIAAIAVLFYLEKWLRMMGVYI